MSQFWVSFKDADGTPREYKVPARKITQLLGRVNRLARKKPINRKAYATEITIRIDRSQVTTR